MTAAAGSHTNPTRERGTLAVASPGRPAGPFAGASGWYGTTVVLVLYFLPVAQWSRISISGKFFCRFRIECYVTRMRDLGDRCIGESDTRPNIVYRKETQSRESDPVNGFSRVPVRPSLNSIPFHGLDPLDGRPSRGRRSRPSSSSGSTHRSWRINAFARATDAKAPGWRIAGRFLSPGATSRFRHFPGDEGAPASLVPGLRTAGGAQRSRGGVQPSRAILFHDRRTPPTR